MSSESNEEKSHQKEDKRDDNVGYIEHQVSILRGEINSRLDKIEIPNPPTITFSEPLSSYLYNASNYLNSQYPYASLLSRTHGSLIASSSVLFVAFSPIRRAPRKVYLCTVFATAAVSYGFNELVKYKWYHDPKQK